jgi:hypothetical protein
MLIQTLPDQYTVWDKAASIQFRRPGTEELYARFRLSDDELATIRERLETADSIDREYAVDVVVADGTTHATVEKTVYVGRDRAT